ncbi:MAG: replication-associated recombination protein A [Spirochaetota bacterium]
MADLLFTRSNPALTPLAERMRPISPDDYMGQEHLLGKGRIVRVMIDKKTPFSVMLWGDPGCGKTTLARMISEQLNMDAFFLSAISSGVADVRRVIEKGKQNKALGVPTLLFIDEIHRFNKAQQDAVLGAVEAGDVVLIGATTENPSFSIISPLLSRTRVLKLYPLKEEDLEKILTAALEKDEFLKKKNVRFEGSAREKAVLFSQGDARRLLNLVELASMIADDGVISDDILKEALKEVAVNYDKTGDKHYDTISAFIKSMRGSDPDAAVYYLARMIEGGEDPVFIARRMIIFSSEDVGNASPQALPIAVAALTAVQNIGMPEARIILAQCAIFLASSPKSNAAETAIDSALASVRESQFPIPLHIRNAPTALMTQMGYGKNYRYPHDFPDHFVTEQYLPDELKDAVFYNPGTQGSEAQIRQRMEKLWPHRYKK